MQCKTPVCKISQVKIFTISNHLPLKNLGKKLLSTQQLNPALFRLFLLSSRTHRVCFFFKSNKNIRIVKRSIGFFARLSALSFCGTLLIAPTTRSVQSMWCARGGRVFTVCVTSLSQIAAKEELI